MRILVYLLMCTAVRARVFMCTPGSAMPHGVAYLETWFRLDSSVNPIPYTLRRSACNASLAASACDIVRPLVGGSPCLHPTTAVALLHKQYPALAVRTPVLNHNAWSPSIADTLLVVVAALTIAGTSVVSLKSLFALR